MVAFGWPADLEIRDTADLEVWLRLAKPQPKERRVYAASTLGVRQPVKLEEGLESWKESKFILQMNLQDWRLFPVGHFPHGFRFNAPA